VGITIVEKNKQQQATILFQSILQKQLFVHNEQTRLFKAKLGVELVKQLELQGTRGDVALLAKTISSSNDSAKRIIHAVLEDDVKNLFKFKARTAGIKGTEWLEKFHSFAFQPENARSMPGFESISVAYGKRLPKFLAQDSKKNIVKRFQVESGCPFGKRVLIREFPANIVILSNRDVERNACPVHANFRRKIQAAQKYGLIQDPQSSCRVIVSNFMCDSPDPFNPKSWKKECGLGSCSSCPKPLFVTPEGDENKVVHFSLWCLQKVKGKVKYGLWDTAKLLSQLSVELNQEVPQMKGHIFRAATL
jgi:hypothetical protein